MNFYLPYPSLVMPLSQVTRADISIPTRPAIQESDIDDFSRFYRRGSEVANTYKNTSVYPRIIRKCL